MNQTFCILGRTTLFVCSYAFQFPPCAPTRPLFLSCFVPCFCWSCVCLMHKTRHGAARLSPLSAESQPSRLCSHGCHHPTRLSWCLCSLIQYIALTVPVQNLVCILYAHKYVYSLMYVCIGCFSISVYVRVFVHSLSLEMCGYSYTLSVCQLKNKKYECQHPLLISYFYSHFVMLKQ